MVLEEAKKHDPNMVTKTSIMLGFGETDEEVLQTMKGEEVTWSPKAKGYVKSLMNAIIEF